jgi:hypothetical protein
MMGTKCVSTTMLNHQSDPAIPPGFGPFISFSLGATQESGAQTGVTAVSSSTSESGPLTGSENQRKSRRNRRSVDYSQFDICTEDYSQVFFCGHCSDQFVHFLFYFSLLTAVLIVTKFDCKQDFPSARSLPKGVLRGCKECLNCQKVRLSFFCFSFT